jgi:thioesterase domain-containing protein
VLSMFRHPTARRLAAVLERPSAGMTNWGLVDLASPAADGPPIFLVHPVGGSVLCYRELARQLGSTLPVCAIPAAGLSGLPQRSDIRAMAHAYLRLVTDRQPGGPYRLGGWSFGGAVAAEMAALLRADGQQVELVALLDTHLFLADQAATYCAAELLADFAAEIGLPPPNAAVTDPELAFDELVAAAERADETPGSARDWLRRHWDVSRANIGALMAYRPAADPGPSLLLRPESSAPGDLGWHAVAAELTVRTVPGDHYSMLDGAGAAACAAAIRLRLQAGEQPATPTRQHDS